MEQEDYMNKKDTLVNLLDFALACREALESMLTTDQKAASGTYETWSAKDMIAHVTYWLDRDLKSLDMAHGSVPVVNVDSLDEENRKVFATYSDTPWDQVNSFHKKTFTEARKRVLDMSEDDLLADIVRTDGSRRIVWQQLTGHALSHMTSHFALVYHRIGKDDQATQLQEKTAILLRGLDENPEWLGMIQYNLACHYARMEQGSRAVALLKEALSLSPNLKEWAAKDPDLDSIRDNTGFRALYGA